MLDDPNSIGEDDWLNGNQFIDYFQPLSFGKNRSIANICTLVCVRHIWLSYLNEDR
ncbi:MAG: hypothetical protein IT223_05100 [Crocinitomicaceae bacterium]|nr:hypothetical protein [Crocinitomicaceae bacterium]